MVVCQAGSIFGRTSAGATGTVSLGIADGLLGVIDELYAGVFDHARLSASLDHIAQLTGASGGQFYLHYHGEDNMRFGVFSNVDLEALRGIDTQTARSMTQIVQRIPLGHVRPIASAWPIDDMKRSPFYHDVLKKLDILHGAAGLVVRNSDYYGVASLNRSERAGPFSDEQFRVLQILVPHFRNVLQITNAMGAMALARHSLANAIDSLSDGIVLTDRKGRVIHLNRAAERKIASNDGLSIRRGHLAADVLDDERALHRLIGQAGRTRGSDSVQRGGTCMIGRPSGAPAWLVLATPCSDVHALAVAPQCPACTILIRDPSRRGGDGMGRLQQVFGLTLQESKVALSVAEGKGLAEAAQSLGLSVLTVRNHLQRVFAKTGASRQAELARLVATLAN